MRRRGQLVLVAATVVAVALVPLVLASLQLGYHDDVRATATDDAPTADTLRALDRAVAATSTDVPSRYPWGANGSAVTHVRNDLRPRIARLRSAQVSDGVYHDVTYNASAADAWRTNRCPGGRGRQFGSCVVDRGVVVQNRANRTHVLAVGFDVTTSTDRGETTVTVVVRPVGPTS